MRHYRRLAFLLVASSLGVGVETALAGGLVRDLGRAEGLPSTQVHDLVQSPSGELWLAGPAGLARYDGTGTQVFGPVDGLSTQGLRAIAVDSEGVLWIGTDQGLERRLADGTIEPVAVGDDWPTSVIDRLVVSRGSVWIGTSQGLKVWRPESGLTPIEEIPPVPITDLSLDEEDQLWVVGPELGLWIQEQGRFSPIDPVHWQKAGSLQSVAAGESTTLVGGTRGVVELRSRGSKVETSAALKGVDIGATSLLRLKEELWIGSPEGLVHFSGPKKDRKREQILSGVSVNRLLADVQGNVWVATNNRGANRISALRHAVNSIPTPCDTQVYSIREDPEGGFFVGGDQCSWRTDQLLQHSTILEGLKKKRTWDLIRARSGSLWAATEEGLWFSNDEIHWSQVTSHVALLGPSRVLLERETDLWAGTISGLFRLNQGQPTEVLDATGTSLGYVYTIREDPAGRLWIGTIGRGLFREAADGFHQVIGEGLQARGNVYAIAVGVDEEMIVIQDSRIVRFFPEGSKLLEPPPGETIAGWSAIVDRKNGDLWVGGNSGLLRYRPGDQLPSQQLTESSGLASSEFTTSRSLLQTESGELICGLSSGWSKVRVEILNQTLTPPKVALGTVLWNQATPETENSRIKVPYGNWTVDFGLYAPWFLDEDSLRFRYRLKGFDDQWSKSLLASELPIRFTGLHQGSYSLETQAGSTLTSWGPTSTVYSFTVVPPWYMSWWALALTPILILAVGYGASRWRYYRLQHLARELEQRVRERTAELDAANLSLKAIASEDPLTGLPNQRSIWSRMRELRAYGERHHKHFAVIVYDLDNFKKVNDQWGHLEGDEVLKAAAHRSRAALRESDFVARFGGEEFVVLLAEVESDDVAVAAEHLRVAISEKPFKLSEGQEVFITASFGWALWKQGELGTEVFRRADEATYRAKARGKNRVEGESSASDD